MESDSESDIAAVDDGEEDTERVRGGAGKEDEAGDHLDPKKVREQLLDYLDELSSAESSTDEEEGDVRRRKYHHLPWRSRCWRVSYSLWAGGLTCTVYCVCVRVCVRVCVGRLYLYPEEGQSQKC